MNTALPQEELEGLFDAAVREVTRKMSGVELCQRAEPPAGELYTVYSTFRSGFRSSLSLCADGTILERMARNTLRREHLTPRELEEFSKEYFNILCGQIAARLFRATRVAARFDVPSFHRGHFEPEGRQRQFALNYANDQREGAQLVHHVPRPAAHMTA